MSKFRRWAYSAATRRITAARWQRLSGGTPNRRAWMLRESLVSALADLAPAKSPHPMLLDPAAGTVYVDADGVWLSIEGTNRYLKRTGRDSQNEAIPMDMALKMFGIEPNCVVDIGANFGEISCWFAR